MIVWICGLPGSGKTTIGQRLAFHWGASLLDGDDCRMWLTPDCDFSEEDRDRHALRIWRVAKAVSEGGGRVVCALMRSAPAAVTCHVVLAGRFRSLWPGSYWATPLNPDLVIDTSAQDADACAKAILAHLTGPPTTLLIGRWQPFHEGHRQLVEAARRSGPVVVGIRERQGKNDPYSFGERRAMIQAACPGVPVIRLPDVVTVAHGRTPGWKVREIILPENTQAISGSGLREMNRTLGVLA